MPASQTGGAASALPPARRPRPAPAGTPLLAAVVARQLGRLLAACPLDPGAAARIRRLLTLFAAESLDRPATPPFEGLSSINADGLPFQWVFNLSSRGQGLGFLCEVGRPGACVAFRLAQTLDRIAAACSIAHDADPVFLRRAAAILLPADGEAWPAHWRSAAWVGVAAHGRRVTLKPYFNLNRDSCRERWLRAGRLLKALGREHGLAKLCDLSSFCSPGSQPVGLAMDLLPDGAVGRVKLYFRSEAVSLAWLERWHQAAGAAEAAPLVRRVLDLFGPVNRRILPPGGIVVSLEIHADEQLSLKTDLAVTKWTEEDRTLFEAARAFLPASTPAAGTLAAWRHALGLGQGGAANGANVRFVGIGLEPDASWHLNMYVQPPLAPPAAPEIARRRRCSGTAAADAIRKAAAALLRCLSDHHWEDFLLPVGRSDAWVTAYMLAMLTDWPASLRDGMRAELAAVVGWLEGARQPDGGWGYNAAVPADADSTAWAIIALRARGRTVPSGAIGFLNGCRQRGGFATYPALTSPARTWAACVPDVTAVAARALGEPHAAAAALAAQDELTPAYWWTTPLYTTAMRLDCTSGRPVNERLRRRLAHFAPAGAFERALVVRAALRAGLNPSRHVSGLLAEQGADGLWLGTARLRLAAEGAGAPWQKIDSGTLYRDDRGLFTTATALAALAAFVAGRPADAHLEGPQPRDLAGHMC